MLSSKIVKMQEGERAAREKLAGLEHGKGRESLGFWFIAPGSSGQSCCFCLSVCAGIGWINPQIEEQQIYHWALNLVFTYKNSSRVTSVNE